MRIALFRPHRPRRARRADASIREKPSLGRLILLLAATAALASSLACARSENDDLSLLRVFYTSDAMGYLEPCG